MGNQELFELPGGRLAADEAGSLGELAAEMELSRSGLLVSCSVERSNATCRCTSFACVVSGLYISKYFRYLACEFSIDMRANGAV